MRKRSLGRLGLVLAIIVAVTCVVVVGRSRLFRPSGDTTNVRIGYLPFASDAALFAAYDRGYFREEGVKVELVRFSAANDNLNALLSGRVDMCGMLGFPTLFA